MFRKPAVLITILLLLLPAVSLAKGKRGASKKKEAPVEEFFATTEKARLFPAQSLFSFDINGSFRWRTEIWRDVHLGLVTVGNDGKYYHVNTYGVYVQPSEQTGDKDDPVESGTVESTDIRLRIDPTLHIGELIDIGASIDLFNAMAGEGGETASARQFMDYYSINAPGSFSSPLNSVAVRTLWGRVKVFNLLTIEVGRFPTQWGMGLLENDGSGIDADGGDAVDSLAVTADLKGYLLYFSWDWPLSGFSEENPFAPWGEPHNSGEADDILQFRLKLFQKDRRDLPHADSFGWGLYSRFRWQDFSSLGALPTDEQCADTAYAATYDCTRLYWRDAFLWTPDIWFKVEKRFSPKFAFRFETEILGRYGTIESTRRQDPDGSKRTLFGLGGVVRGDFLFKRGSTFLEFGTGTGDRDAVAFGIVDDPVMGEPEDPAAGKDETSNQNDSVTSFSLHPNHRTDLILFRRVIGAVTNAWYLKLNGRLDLVDRGEFRLWANLSCLYARAWFAGSTPGKDEELGFETDLAIGADVTSHAAFRVEGGFLIPFEGLKGASKLDNPVPWTVRILLNFAF